METNQLEMHIEDGLFSIDNMEKTRLHGKYQIKTTRNNACLPDSHELDENIANQAVFGVGNVLLRSTTDKIDELIDVFIRYTHDPCKDLELDFIHEYKQMRFGTICPTKKTLFKYKSKVFVAYGRYIFGFDKCFAEFRRNGSGCDDSTDDEEKSSFSEGDDEEDESRILDEITQDRIILKNPAYAPYLHDHVYSFYIYDDKSGVLDAFGLYR